jgi:hypothetical protein
MRAQPREKPALVMITEIATKVMTTMQRVMIDVTFPPLPLDVFGHEVRTWHESY